MMNFISIICYSILPRHVIDAVGGEGKWKQIGFGRKASSEWRGLFHALKLRNRKNPNGMSIFFYRVFLIFGNNDKVFSVGVSV